MPAKDSSRVGRKPRITGIEKYVKKYGAKVLTDWGPPILRYSVVPVTIVYAMYYTDPDPSLMDLVWPLPF